MIELTESEAAVWALSFTLVGALIAAFAAVYSARLAAEKQQLYIESARFASEFVNEVIALRKGKDDAFQIINDQVLASQHKAKVRFEPWVKKSKIQSFHDAWRDYENSPKTQSPGSVNNRKPECAAALAQIERLLSFARTKG